MKLSTKGKYGLRALIDLAQYSEDSPVSITSIARRQDISERYLEQLMSKLKKAGLVKSILCAIIGLVGLLNFFNAMMTSILSRRREFAVLQAVGMTNRQLKTMLIYEGLFYAMSSVAVAFILSLAVGPLAGKMLGSMFWFFEYRFTILPVLLTIPVFLLLGWLIPCMMYDNAAKCSVVEQLRDAQ